MSGTQGSGVRTRFTAAPGISLIAIATQVGPTRGIEIDNPSGSWLQIPSLETSIPPYTTGWAFGFPYDVASLDVLSRDRAPTGPAGQISTIQGDAIVVYLTDLELERKVGGPSGNASGSPTSDQNFITAFTPVLSATSGLTTAKVFAPTIVTLAAAIPAKRFRLWSFTLDRGDVAGGIMRVLLEDSIPVQVAVLRLKYAETHADLIYPQGLDFPVGEPINARFTALVGTSNAQGSVFITYSVI